MSGEPGERTQGGSIAAHVAASGISGDDLIVLAAALEGETPAACDLDAFMYLPDDAASLRVAVLLRKDGYRASVESDGSSWGVVAHRTMIADELAIVALRRQMEALAASEGGRFDFWQGSLAPNSGAVVEDSLHFAPPRLLRYRPVTLPFGWTHERHEKYARSVARRPQAALREVVALPSRETRRDLHGSWHVFAAVTDGREEIEAVSYLQARVPPASGEAGDPTSAIYWLREPEFLSNAVAPHFPMPHGLRTPRYHFLLVLKRPDGSESVRYCGFERRDVYHALSWDVARFAQAAYALGRWQGAVAQDAAALAHPVLFNDPIAALTPGRGLIDGTARPFASRLLRSPRTVCHHRITAYDLFEDPADSNVTVLAEWGLVGAGPIGSDLAALVFQAQQSRNVPINAFADLERRALSRYVDGVRESGCVVDSASVRFAYAATAALQFSTGAPGKDADSQRVLAGRAAALGAEAAAES